MLTEKQQKFYDYIVKFHEENGYSPSIREICSSLGLASTSTVKSMLDKLCAKGVLTSVSGKARSIMPVNQNQKGVPIIGHIRAGVPVMAEENIEGYIPVKEFLRNSNGGFFLVVDGYSMQGKGILPGDFVFIKPQKIISNGQIGAFRLNGEVTLKIFSRTAQGVFLLPSNSDFSPIPVKDTDEFEVIGRYVMLLRLIEKGYDIRFV